MTIQEMKERKAELGYTNEQIAELSGVPLGTVQKVFGGTTSSPRYDTIQKLERILKPGPFEHTVREASGARDLYSSAFSARRMQGFSEPRDASSSAGDAWMVKEVGEGDDFSYSQLPSSKNRRREAAAPYAGKRQGEYTADDYYALPGDVRAELIDGTFYAMETPSVPHQSLLAILSYELRAYVRKKRKSCTVLFAPCAVQLGVDDRTVVEPDVLVVCDPKKLKRRCCCGAPDLIIEVISPQTKRKDMTIKAEKYSDAGVREYWLVDPDSRRILVYDFENNAFPRIYGFDAKVPAAIWGGDLEIDFAPIGDEIAFLYEEERGD